MCTDVEREGERGRAYYIYKCYTDTFRSRVTESTVNRVQEMDLNQPLEFRDAFNEVTKLTVAISSNMRPTPDTLLELFTPALKARVRFSSTK